MCFCRLIYVLKDLIWQYEILIQNAIQIFAIFHNIIFFLKNYFYFFFIKIIFALFNVLFVGYSLAKNNLNNTYQYMISKIFSDNELLNYINKIQSESFFVPISVWYVQVNNIKVSLVFFVSVLRKTLISYELDNPSFFLWTMPNLLFIYAIIVWQLKLAYM
jgi:hypothetical protein